MDNLHHYPDATGVHLGIEEDSVCGGFRAIVAHRWHISFVFEQLEERAPVEIQILGFLDDNPLFPSARGATPLGALKTLDRKLGLLYRFEQGTRTCATSWRAVPRNSLQALYDSEPGDELQEMQDHPYYYEHLKKNANQSQWRNVHALLTYRSEGDFAQLETRL